MSNNDFLYGSFVACVICKKGDLPSFRSMLKTSPTGGSMTYLCCSECYEKTKSKWEKNMWEVGEEKEKEE